jgi:putative lipoprotein (rSAM/lipoprotein system)
MEKAKIRGRKILRKIYTALGLTATALVFQACYGTPPSMGLDVLVRGVVKSKTGKTIEGIKVSVKNMYQYEHTDNSGRFQIYVPGGEMYTFLFEDIDGAKNGSYALREISVDAAEEKIDLNDIVLDAAE